MPPDESTGSAHAFGTVRARSEPDRATRQLFLPHSAGRADPDADSPGMPLVPPSPRYGAGAFRRDQRCPAHPRGAAGLDRRTFPRRPLPRLCRRQTFPRRQHRPRRMVPARCATAGFDRRRNSRRMRPAISMPRARWRISPNSPPSCRRRHLASAFGAQDLTPSPFNTPPKDSPYFLDDNALARRDLDLAAVPAAPTPSVPPSLPDPNSRRASARRAGNIPADPAGG